MNRLTQITHKVRRADRRLPLVELCEYVRVGDGAALLRVAVRTGSPCAHSPELVVAGEGLAERFEAMPDGSDGDVVAFPVPLKLITCPGMRLTLQAADGLLIELPEPAERAIGAAAAPAEPGVAAVDVEDARALIEQLQRRCLLSERALARERDAATPDSAKLVAAWSELAELRELLDAREEAHRRSGSLAEAWRARETELVRQLDAAAVELARLESVAGERDLAREQLATTEEELAIVSAAREQAEAAASRAADELAEALELAQAATARAEQAEEAARWEAEKAERLTDQLAQERDRAAALGAEHERLAIEAAAEHERLGAELGAERERLEAELAADRERLEAELAAERERLEAEAAAERQRLESDLTAERERRDTDLAAERARVEAEAAAERDRLQAELIGELERLEAELAAERERVESETSAEPATVSDDARGRASQGAFAMAVLRMAKARERELREQLQARSETDAAAGNGNGTPPLGALRSLFANLSVAQERPAREPDETSDWSGILERLEATGRASKRSRR